MFVEVVGEVEELDVTNLNDSLLHTLSTPLVTHVNLASIEQKYRDLLFEALAQCQPV